jgi:hypothetical protein
MAAMELIDSLRGAIIRSTVILLSLAWFGGVEGRMRAAISERCDL